MQWITMSEISFESGRESKFSQCIFSAVSNQCSSIYMDPAILAKLNYYLVQDVNLRINPIIVQRKVDDSISLTLPFFKIAIWVTIFLNRIR